MLTHVLYRVLHGSPPFVVVVVVVDDGVWQSVDATDPDVDPNNNNYGYCD